MYEKPEFAPRGADDIRRVLHEHPFATLITVDDGVPVQTHLSFVHEAERGQRGTLVSHLAAGNPQVSSIRAGATATVMFRGEHGYVSPSWLRERSHTVPTWNYETVECRGPLVELADRVQALQALTKLVRQHEVGRPQRWKIGEQAQSALHRRLDKIVCFEIPIESWQAKFKLHQDEWASDVVDAAQQLRQQGQERLAGLMEQFNQDRLSVEDGSDSSSHN